MVCERGRRFCMACKSHVLHHGQVSAMVWRTRTPRHEYALDLMLCMPSQYHAIGLQTDGMVAVPAPVVRLPDSHVYALWP